MPLLVVILPSADIQFVDQAVGVDVVEAVARRHIGSFVREDCGEVRVFAVEVDYVGGEMALLQTGSELRAR